MQDRDSKQTPNEPTQQAPYRYVGFSAAMASLIEASGEQAERSQQGGSSTERVEAPIELDDDSGKEDELGQDYTISMITVSTIETEEENKKGSVGIVQEEIFDSDSEDEQKKSESRKTHLERAGKEEDKPESDEEVEAVQEATEEGQRDSVEFERGAEEGQRDSGEEERDDQISLDPTSLVSTNLTEKKLSFPGVPRIRGNVVLEKKLGEGAFGQVYQGKWNDRAVALKKIDLAQAKQNVLYGELHSEGLLEALEWEVSRLSTVSHANCVQFYGIYEEASEQQIYLVMEFCEGGTLEGVLKKAHPSWAQRWQWALEITRGLAYLHQGGVLHRDLKAENILLDQYGRAKLADLGVAQVDALLSDREAKAVSKGLQDNHFISPEKSLSSYNEGQNPATTSHNQTQLVWLNREKVPLEEAMDASMIYLKMTNFGIEASWLSDGKKISTLAGKRHSELIVSYFNGRTVINKAVEEETFETIAQLCGYVTLPSMDTQATDIYALGFVFWQMISGGKTPRVHLGNASTLDDMPRSEWILWILGGSSSNYEREAIPIDCPPEWKQLILDCWAYDAEKRPSAESLVARLQGFAARFYVTSSTLEQPIDTLLCACEKLDDLIHPKRLEGLHYLAPYLTKSRIEEPIDRYWQRFEAADAQKFSHHPFGQNTPVAQGLVSNPPLPLEENLTEFLNTPGSGVLLLLGDSGLGKTLATYRLADELLNAWRNYFRDSQMYPKPPYFPVFIRPVLHQWSYQALDQGLQKTLQAYGLANTPVSLLLIIDGYDECQMDKVPQNLCTQLGVESSINHPIKVLVTCRPHTVPPNEYIKRFGLQDQLTVRYFLPFRLDQVLAYSHRHIGYDETMRKTYEKMFKEATPLRAVLRNPFVLQLFIQSWETLSQKEKDIQQLNRWKIYAGFVEHWLKTQKHLLSEPIHTLLAHPSSDLLESFYTFASQVAFKIFQQKKGFLLHPDVKAFATPWARLLKAVEADSRKLFAARQATHTTFATKRRALLTEKDYVQIMMNRLQQFEEGSPLKRRELDYEFTHKSFFEYFAAKHLLQLVQYDANVIQTKGLALLNHRSLQEEPEILAFWHEGWQLMQHRSLIEPFFEVIQASKENVSVSQAAANAATLLNVVHIPFSGRDFSGVSLPGANLSRALLDHTNFHRANLEGVQLHQAFLRGANLNMANLADVTFGELPSLPFKERVNGIAYRCDGGLLAVAVGNEIHLWRGDYSECVGVLRGHAAEVTSIAFDKNNVFLASGSQDKSVRLWSLGDQNVVTVLQGHTGGVTGVVFQSTGSLLASASEDGSVRLWSIREQKETAVFKGHVAGVTSVAFDKSGQLLASGGDDKQVRLWSVTEQKEVAVFKGHKGSVTSVAFHPTEKWLVSGSEDKSIRVWSVVEQKEIAVLQGHTDGITSVAFNEPGTLLASGGNWKEKSVRLWSVAEQKAVAVFQGHLDGVTSVAFHPSGEWLASSGSWQDKCVRLWSVAAQKEIGMLPGHTDEVKSLAFDKQGIFLVSGSWDASIRVWLLSEQKEVSVLQGHTSCVNSVTFDSRGVQLVSGSEDKSVRLWSIEQQKELAIFNSHTRGVTSVAFNHNDTLIASGGKDNSVRIYAVAEQKEVVVLKGHTDEVNTVAFDRQGALLASGGQDQCVRLWSITEQKEIAVLQGHTDGVTRVVFDESGRLLASGGSWQDKSIRVWSVTERKQIAMFQGHTDKVNCSDFDKTGAFLVSGSDDKTVRVWSVVERKEVALLEGHNSAVNSVAFDQSRHCIASGSSDKSILVWQCVPANIGQWQVVWRIMTVCNLIAPKAQLEGAIISPQNQKLLKQLGAVGEHFVKPKLGKQSANQQSMSSQPTQNTQSVLVTTITTTTTTTMTTSTTQISASHFASPLSQPASTVTSRDYLANPVSSTSPTFAPVLGTQERPKPEKETPSPKNQLLPQNVNTSSNQGRGGDKEKCVFM